MAWTKDRPPWLPTVPHPAVPPTHAKDDCEQCRFYFLLVPHNPSSISVKTYHSYLLYDIMQAWIEKAIKLLHLPRLLPSFVVVKYSRREGVYTQSVWYIYRYVPLMLVWDVINYSSPSLPLNGEHLWLVTPKYT